MTVIEDAVADTAPDELPSRSSAPVEGTRSVRVRHVPSSVRSARETVSADLASRGVAPSVIEEAEAVVAEFVGNAVLHARPLADGCVRVRWKVKGPGVEIEVRDGGGEDVPHPVRRSPWAVDGRGLRIVRSLAHEWGVQEERNGRTVWAALGAPSRRRRF